VTTYEEILKRKPNFILDVVRADVFVELGKPGHEYINGGNCYEWKYAVAKYLQPKTILEIGVRYGYSLCSFIAACLPRYVEGIDSEVYVPGSNAIAWANVKRWQLDSVFRCCDSARIEALERDYDLVHIDGSHSYDTCLHDLNLCLGKARAILIDDMHTCDDDRRAVKMFMQQNPSRIAEVVALPTLHGDVLLLMA